MARMCIIELKPSKVINVVSWSLRSEILTTSEFRVIYNQTNINSLLIKWKNKKLIPEHERHVKKCD